MSALFICGTALAASVAIGFVRSTKSAVDQPERVPTTAQQKLAAVEAALNQPLAQPGA